jgi:hypothetical protein
MNDKSPRQNLSKKSAKSIKEKRAARRDKQADEHASVVPTRKGKPGR